MRTIRLLPVVLAICAGCGGGGVGSHDEAADETLKAMERFATILEGIRDKASADAATPKLEALGKDLDGLIEAVGKLGEPGEEEARKVAGKMLRGRGGLSERMDTVTARLDASGLAASIDALAAAVMGKFMTLVGKLGG